MGKKKRSGPKPAQKNTAGAQGSLAYKNDVLRQQLSGLLDEYTLPSVEVVLTPPEPEALPEPEPETDEDLFTAALADIRGTDALLEKYDVVTAPAAKAGTKKPKGAAAASGREIGDEGPEDAGDQRLFLDAVGDVTPETFRRAKKAPRE